MWDSAGASFYLRTSRGDDSDPARRAAPIVRHVRQNSRGSSSPYARDLPDKARNPQARHSQRVEIAIGILVFQTAVMTVLAALTYSYAQSTKRAADSTHTVANANIELAKAAKEQLSFLEQKRKHEERVIVADIFAELKESMMRRKPPFAASAWERSRGKFNATAQLTEVQKSQVAAAYLAMAEAPNLRQKARNRVNAM